MVMGWTVTESSGSLEIYGVLKATQVVVTLRGNRTRVLEVMEGLIRALVVSERLPNDA